MLNQSVTGLKAHEDAEDSASKHLTAINDKKATLKRANRVILTQQTAIIEEQRLNIRFQMLGITLHELNQPLTSLLGNIELMGLNQDNPEKLKENIKRVEDAGKRFSGIIRKIQAIRQGTALNQDTRFCPMKTNKQWKFYAIVSDETVAKKIQSVMVKNQNVEVVFHDTGSDIETVDVQKGIDLVITDGQCLMEYGSSIIQQIKHQNNELPVLAILGPDCEETAFKLIQDGLDDYFTLPEFDQITVGRTLQYLKEKTLIGHQLNSALNDLAGMSIQDEQTGLFQRKFFRDALEREITKAKRQDMSCVIGKLDLTDTLEEIQSREESNLAGVLRNVSSIIQDILGSNHLVCRYGNESFAFILSNTSVKKAQVMCEDLQSKLAQYFVLAFSLNPSTLNFIGLTQFCPQNDCSATDLMGRIDKATSRARNIGEGLIFIFE